MLEQLKYINHLGQYFECGKNGIFVDTNDLHDYEWTVTEKNNRVSSLDYSISNRKLPVIIICETEDEGIGKRNWLHKVVEQDVLAMQHGRIIIGDYYFRCFVTKSEKQDYLYSKRYMKVTLTLTSDFPYWVKETTVSFIKNGSTDGGFLDYGFDYPVDFKTDIQSNQLSRSGFAPCNFRLIIEGACNNPVVYIAGHPYQVNCSVPAGEHLTIDSSAKKIYITNNTGEVTNVFNSRSRDAYIFEKIPAGSSSVSWDGNFNFEIVLLEERSEPEWI